IAAVRGTYSAAQRAETEGVAAALVAEDRAPATAANEPAVLGATPCDRAGARDEQDAGLVTERIRECGLGVRRDRHVPRDLLALELRADRVTQVGAARTRECAAECMHGSVGVSGGNRAPREHGETPDAGGRIGWIHDARTTLEPCALVARFIHYDGGRMRRTTIDADDESTAHQALPAGVSRPRSAALALPTAS